MNQEQALNILIQAVQLGQSKGAYNLKDASIISQAMDIFVKPQDAVAEEIKEKENIKED